MRQTEGIKQLVWSQRYSLELRIFEVDRGFDSTTIAASLLLLMMRKTQITISVPSNLCINVKLDSCKSHNYIFFQ